MRAHLIIHNIIYLPIIVITKVFCTTTFAFTFTVWSKFLLYFFGYTKISCTYYIWIEFTQWYHHLASKCFFPIIVIICTQASSLLFFLRCLHLLAMRLCFLPLAASSTYISFNGYHITNLQSHYYKIYGL